MDKQSHKQSYPSDQDKMWSVFIKSSFYVSIGVAAILVAMAVFLLD